MSQIGTIYNKSNWSSFSDFNISAGWSISGGKLVSPANANQYLQRSYATALNQTAIGFITNNRDTVLEIHGIAENNIHNLCSITSTGYLKIRLTYDSVDWLSTSPLAIAGGDLLKYEFTKDGWSYSFKVTNITTTASVMVNATSVMSVSRLRIYSPTVSTISNIFQTSTQESGALLVVGDSIAYGSASTTESGRWASLSGLQVEAGPGDRSVEMVALLPEITKFVRPTTVFLAIGTNDGNINVWKSNLNTIKNALTQNGIGLVVCSPYANNIRDMLPFKTYIEATFSMNIDFYTPTKETSGWTLKAAFDSGDGVHPNNSGHAAISAAFLASPWHDYVPPVDTAYLYRARKMTMQYL